MNKSWGRATKKEMDFLEVFLRVKAIQARGKTKKDLLELANRLKTYSVQRGTNHVRGEGRVKR